MKTFYINKPQTKRNTERKKFALTFKKGKIYRWVYKKYET